MSRELIESIVSNNMLDANDMVEAKLAEIRERKLYEMKRMFAAEAFGRPSPDEQRAAGRVRASDVHPDPRDAPMPGFDSGSKSSGTKPKKPRKARPGKKPEEPKPQEKVTRDWKTSAKLGLKRTGTRVAYGLGYPIGRAIGIGKNALSATKSAISDPIPAAKSAIKSTAKTTGKVAGHVGRTIQSAPVTQDMKDIGFRNI